MKKLWKTIAMVLGLLVIPFNKDLIDQNSAWACPQSIADSSSPMEPKLTEAEIHAIIQQARDAWVNRDADAFASLFATDGEFLVPGNRWMGQDAIRQVAADFAANTASVTIEIRRVIVQGNQAAVEWVWQDTSSSGSVNRADDVIVIDFAGDRIHRWREYIDTQTPQK